VSIKARQEQIKQVGIWIRVSTEDQVKGESPEHHEQRARFYAQAKGWEVTEVYHLEAVSGKSVMEHSETKRMLKDIESEKITGLIFSKLARLARNTKELLELADIFRDYGADLISLGESIDTSTPAGRLFYTIVAAMAQWEREEISARVAASVPIRAKLGKSTGGQAPFGYQWKDKKLIPDPKEAPVRKLIYELFKQHKRKRTVARLLNEGGYRTRSGSKFSDNSIHRLVEDPIAKGVRRANYTKSLGNKKHWKLKPQEEWIFTEVEPVVSEELWEECNCILTAMHNGHKPARKAVQLFGGFIYCHCGHKMYKPSNMEKYVCTKCRNKIPTDDLEAVFHEQLKGFVFSPEEVANYLGQSDQAIEEKQELLAGLERERQKVEAEMDKIMELYVAGEIRKDGFGKKYQPLEDRLAQIDDQIPQLQGEIDFLKIQHLSSDEIIAEAKDFYNRWPDLDQSEKRQVIEAITETIIIGTDDVEINLGYLPISSEFVTKARHNLTGSSPRRA
jgi:site-specific DNA recombinase